MKNFIVAALSILAFNSFGQKSGYIEYETKINIHKHMTGEMEQWKAMVPEFRTANNKLIFNENAALFEKAQVEVKTADEDSHRSWGSEEPDNKRYVNLSTKEITSKTELMGKTFLILDTLKRMKWKITGQAKMIQGLPCISAVHSDTSDAYTAWFTAAIPASVGPRHFDQLPGAVLEVVNKDSSIHTIATRVEQREVKDEEIVKTFKREESHESRI